MAYKSKVFTLEKDIEDRAVRLARKLKMIPLKLEIQGVKDAPDRVFFYEGGNAFFIEFKKPLVEPSRGQLKAIRALRRMGFKVYIIDNYPQAKKVIERHAV